MPRPTLRPPLVLPLLLLCAGTAMGQPIPPHPDRLRFAPFRYVPPHAKDHRVVLPRSQVVAYLAEDHELPLVQVEVFIRVGTYLDPRGKEGLAGLVGYLLSRGGTEGRKPYSAEELEERLAFLAAQLNSSVGETQGSVSLNLLSKDLDEGLSILRDVLATPRFDDRRLQLRREQLLSEMRRRNDDAADIEARERRMLAFGEDHFTNRLPTKASIESIRREDLRAFHRQHFHPARFIVAAAGDFDRARMVDKLDALFSNWPFVGVANPGEVPRPQGRLQPGLYLIHKDDVTQGRVSILLPGLMRDDPDYLAVQVMNQILGGGGFISRITNRVRSDEGLAYQAASRFPGGIYYPDVFTAVFQSKLRSCSYAASLVLEEIRKMRQAPPTRQEMEAARRQLIEQLPQLFRTKAQTTATLAQEELTGRYGKDPDFYRLFQERIEKITERDVQRVAQKWLDDQAVTILAVGKRDEMLNPDPKHPVAFPSLVGGKVVDLPLRDPMTLKPLAPKAPAAKEAAR